MALKKVLIAGASFMALASAANAQDAVSTATGAPAGDARDARINALEQALSDIQAQLADLKAGAAADVAEVRRVQAEAPVLDVKNGRPTFSTADGKFKVAVRGLFQVDTASYLQDDRSPDYRGGGGGTAADNVFARDLNSGVNVRRARIGLEGTVLKDWNWALTVEAGGSGTESAQLQQAWIEYAGFKPAGLPLRIRGGVFAATTGLEDATNNTESVFPERAAPAELVRSLAGGDGRNGLGAYINGERWNASAAWTGSLIQNPNNGSTTTVDPVTGLTTVTPSGDFDEQSGYTARINFLPIKSQDYNLHVGVSANGIINPADTIAPGATGSGTVRLRERPELRVDGTRLVDTGNLSAKNVFAIGYEVGANYKNFLLTGEYFDIEVNRPGTLPDAEFSGWYAQGSWVLTGEPRAWNAASGGFGGVKPEKPFKLGESWGAWEIAARYSNLDLNFREGDEGLSIPTGGVRGGEQEVTSLGLNFFPNNVVRFALDYQWVSIDRLNPRSASSSGLPVGVPIGQDYDVVSLRSQVAF
jgi:phosphate-selective porin OprO/OprP